AYLAALHDPNPAAATAQRRTPPGQGRRGIGGRALETGGAVSRLLMDLGSINGIRVQRGADLLVREPAALQKTRLARPLLEVARRGGAELPAAHPLDLGQPVAGAGVDPAGHGLLGQALFLQLAPDAHGSVAPAAAA